MLMTDEKPTERMYTVAEIAKMFRKDGDTVRRWIRRGQLEAIRPGGQSWLISESALQTYLNKTKNM